jgi:hypothetical protein
MKDDFTDAEIETIVAEAIATEAKCASAEAQPPSSAIVWWRAQMRARQEAAQLAERPITIVHGLSIAAGVGLMLSIIGYAIAGVKGSLGWVTNLAQSIGAAAGSLPADVVSRWSGIALTATLVSVVVASIAAYFIFADE